MRYWTWIETKIWWGVGQSKKIRWKGVIRTVHSLGDYLRAVSSPERSSYTRLPICDKILAVILSLVYYTYIDPLRPSLSCFLVSQVLHFLLVCIMDMLSSFTSSFTSPFFSRKLTMPGTHVYIQACHSWKKSPVSIAFLHSFYHSLWEC